MTDETLRKAGRAELDRLNAPAKKQAAQEPSKKRPRYEGRTFGDVLGIGKKKRPVHDGKTVDEAVDEAVKGAKRDPF